MLRSRIIVVFTSVTILLISLMAWTGYRFVRAIYLNQLSDQVTVLCRIISGQIEKPYLEILRIGAPIEGTDLYFREFFARYHRSGLNETIFLFNQRFEILISSDTSLAAGREHPVLLLNRKEINELGFGQAQASLPFKSESGTWYLWGFFRFNDEIWLAVRETAGRFDKISELERLFWIIGICGTILTIFTGWFVARAISQPVERLAKFSAAIGKGEFDTKLPEYKAGEIGLLAKTMGQMRQDLIGLQREKEQLLARIAHEIRNPLGGIELLVNLIGEDLKKDKRETMYVGKIQKEIEGLKSLISDYLGYSRPRDISPVWIDAKNIFAEVNDMIHDVITKKQIHFSIEGDLQRMWFDHIHLRQILINLLVNAAESVAPGGHICLYHTESNGRWVVAVQDDGTGIGTDIMSKIYTPYFTTKKDGTGLGLAISRKLSAENKSQLRLVSNNKGGCTFFLIKQKMNYA